MPKTSDAGSRDRLIRAAADLVSAAPGQDVPLRAICERAGVTLPTLYHFFGSKEGLLDAVVAHGVDRYLAVKDGTQGTGDPLSDLRHGWDAHVAFGLENPAFYALMYGRIRPGRRSAGVERPYERLLELTTRAAARGMLRVSAGEAADLVIAANVGVTLALISAEHPDRAIADRLREATIAAIARDGVSVGEVEHPVAAASAALAAAIDLAGDDLPLGDPERALLRTWLDRLG